MNSRAINPAGDKRERVVRQNRFDLSGEGCTIIVANEAYEVSDCSPFGIAFRSNIEFSKNQQVQNCDVIFNGIKIGDISIRVIRSERENNVCKVACEIIGQPLEMEKISGIRMASQVTLRHKSETEKNLQVPEDFRRLVWEMKVWLLSLKDYVDELDKKTDFNGVNDKNDFENTVANTIGSYIVQTFESQYIKLNEILKNVSATTKEMSFEFFRSQMIDLLLKAPFHNRAFTKPLGYAGDYQMMNQIYAHEGMGDSLFAKCLHLYFISAPESRAVRNRAVYLYDQILKGANKNAGKEYHILSVACGPAFEMQKFIKNHPDLAAKTKFSLLDQDIEALQHAQRKIKVLERDMGLSIECEFIHKPIKHVIAKGLSGKYDLIYSAGLFDYFTDPVAQMAARRLHEALKDSGKLIIGNFSNASLGQLTMDIALDWHLIYRSTENLESLFSEIGKNFRIESEEEGINLFCHLDK